ncbi:MAG: hypothetical protein HOO96_28000 [Polyangiaceae bacterium]|nr:hypothetical protein [Polyangiaceae bacterium]
MSRLVPLLFVTLLAQSIGGCSGGGDTGGGASDDQDLSQSRCNTAQFDRSFECRIAGQAEAHFENKEVCITYVRDNSSLLLGLVEKVSDGCPLMRQSKQAIAKTGLAFVETRVSQTRSPTWSESRSWGAANPPYRGATFKWLVGQFGIF